MESLSPIQIVCQTICGSKYFSISFTSEGDKLPFQFISSDLVGSISVKEQRKGGLVVYYAGGNSGLYNVGYIPTVKGQYSISVKINNVDIETDLSAGVWVYSANQVQFILLIRPLHLQPKGSWNFYYSSNCRLKRARQ